MKRFEKIVMISFFSFFSSLFFSSCGAQSVGFIVGWMQTVDHNADYLKINSKGETLGKYDKHKDFENDFFSLSTAISCIGEEFKFEFPNTMHEIKGDPYIISLSVENSSDLVDYVLLKKVIVIFNESEKDLLNDMVCSDDYEDLNYTIWTFKIYDARHSESSSITKRQHKAFLETKKFVFVQNNTSSEKEEFTIKKFSISFPEIEFKESENVKIHYEVEICTVDGKIVPVRQDVNYTLKKETVKLYHPIFNNGKKK